MFRGIPFAQPPVGPLRWREAQPVRPWRGTRDATHFGADCQQATRTGKAAWPQSEDCLTLSVMTPDHRAGPLPVLFQIHGGAYAFGAGREAIEAGFTPLLRKGVILVSPNYRVGRFGFFAHPALRSEANHGTGNFWLSDQLAALRWVRRNIARFGGDPGRVTILGCSAGGSSVNALMATPAAQGLFSRASVHSGGGFFNATRPLDQAEREGLAFAARMGVTRDDAAALHALRLLTPQAVIAGDPGPPQFGAIVDGNLIREPISLTFAKGLQAHVPMIAGSTSDEASVFGLMGFDSGVLRHRFGIDLAEMRRYYGDETTLDEVHLLRLVQTDFLFTSAATGMSALASRSAPSWAYHFAYVPLAQRATAFGAPHCADMEYLLHDGAGPGGKLRDYWYNFIALGHPNGPDLPLWAPMLPDRKQVLMVRDDMRMEELPRSEAIAFWYRRWRSETGFATLP